MTRLDAGDELDEAPVASAGPRLLRFASREVPLGGIRGLRVHRSLPQRDLPMVGAWCFLDRFGPQTARMRVEPHPHIGLQTVSWPFLGEVRHRDSLGSDVVICRGSLNLMTSGAGIAHSEYSTGDRAVPLDALQLWIALPEDRRHGPAAFERHDDLPVIDLGGASATVVVGELGGRRSPATVHTPIVGAELRLAAGAAADVPLAGEWEHAVLGVAGDATVDGEEILRPGDLLHLGTQRERVALHSTTGATVFLVGGEPFDEEIVMWWNFVGRSHEEIVAARDAWEDGDPRFGLVAGHGEERIPAPALPRVRLTRRRRRLAP